jgi:hypothetical protein
MKKKKTLEIINVSETVLDELTSRLTDGLPLLDGDAKILLSLLSTYKWFQRQLKSTKLTIHRLKKMFGFHTEKRSWSKKTTLPGELSEQDVVNGDIQPNSITLNDAELTTTKK